MRTPAEHLFYTTDKSEQAAISPKELPCSAVLADVLKTLETELQRKGLIDFPEKHCFNPIWFLTETERNVYLWRHGFSLGQKDEFEFWVDLPGLVTKRLKQLESYDSENPFLNPLWGVSAELGSSEKEHEYLKAFIDAFKTIENHAHALSWVASTLLKEKAASSGKKIVLLP